MNPSLALVLSGCCFVAVFGGLALLRREGLSLQFALEGLGLTAVAALLSLAGLLTIHPIVLLIVLYLVTMRVRLLVDLARTLRRAWPPERLLPLYDLALRLGPDPAGRVVVRIDQGATLVRAGRAAEAVPVLEEVLSGRPACLRNLRYHVSACYNLGLAYQKVGEAGRAAEQFQQVCELLPGTLYARMAEKAAEEGGKTEPRP